jgi:hypothetical protein
MANAMSSNLVNMVKGAESWADGMRRIFESILDSFISMITQMAINQAMFGTMKGAAGYAGGGLLGLFGVSSMQHGGITKGMTPAILHPNEAVIPLDKEKRLGPNITNIFYVQATDVDSFARSYSETILGILGQSEKSAGTFRNILKRF